MTTRKQELEFMRDQFTRGDVVRVRGFSGVACWYIGPQTEPGETEWDAKCWNCDGSGVDENLEEIYDGNCLECNGTGAIVEHDEEPEPVETGRALVVMVGDDHKHVVCYEDMTRIEREDFCGECGQIGCTHDGLDREDGWPLATEVIS